MFIRGAQNWNNSVHGNIWKNNATFWIEILENCYPQRQIKYVSTTNLQDGMQALTRKAAFIYHKTQNVLRMIFSKCRYMVFLMLSLLAFSYKSSK